MLEKLKIFRLIEVKAVVLSFVVASAQSSHAQEVGIEELQKDLSIFAGILEESLRLNESTGLFGMSLGGVETTYLHGQGAVFEVRSPLANRRNRMGLASLSSAMQALQLRHNPFEAVRLGASPVSSQVMAIAELSSADESLYSQLLDRVSEIDFSLVAQSSIQQASQSARALRALGDVDDAAFAELEAELEGLRASINENVDSLRDLERDIRAARLAEGDSAAVVDTEITSQSISAADSMSVEPTADTSTLSLRLDSLIAAAEPLKQRALQKAEELRERSEMAETEYAEAWQRDLQLFHDQLYLALCEYGNSLRTLPGDEYVSVVLKGLGEDQPENRRADEVHVISHEQIRLCADGNSDVSVLRQSATVYTY